MKKPIMLISLLIMLSVTINAQDQPKKSSAAEHLSAVINEQGLDSALSMFAEMRSNPEKWDFKEDELDSLGSIFLDSRNYEAALAVLRLNTELFPDSWGANFELAEACLYSGDKECAEKNLAKVIEKNPRFWLGEFILEELDSRLKRAALEQKNSFKPGEQTGLTGPYFGQTLPGLTAELFAPGIVSKAAALNFGCTFSPDGREFYFNHFMTIMVCRQQDEGWTFPEPASFTQNKRALEPHITLDGKSIIFAWFQPTPEKYLKEPGKIHPNRGIYICKRTAAGWSEPEYAGCGGSVTSSLGGKIFISDRRADPESGRSNYSQVKQAVIENGIFTKFLPLGGGLSDLQERFPITSHPCISPDGKTILFDFSLRSGLYAAFLDKSGVWSKPLKLSDHGLSAEAGIAAYSPDGRYIFFQNHGDIYWISSEFVERLRPE